MRDLNENTTNMFVCTMYQSSKINNENGNIPRITHNTFVRYFVYHEPQENSAYGQLLYG